MDNGRTIHPNSYSNRIQQLIKFNVDAMNLTTPPTLGPGIYSGILVFQFASQSGSESLYVTGKNVNKVVFLLKILTV